MKTLKKILTCTLTALLFVTAIFATGCGNGGNEKDNLLITFYEGGFGKKWLENGRPARGYFDGKEAGYMMARKEVAHWFSLHLNVSMKKPTKNAEKALAKFQEFINLEEEKP